MTVSTFTIGKLTIENNYPQIDIVENFYASATERKTLFVVITVSKGVYTFVSAGENMTTEQNNVLDGICTHGTFSSKQAAAEAAFDLAVKTITKIEIAVEVEAQDNSPKVGQIRLSYEYSNMCKKVVYSKITRLTAKTVWYRECNEVGEFYSFSEEKGIRIDKVELYLGEPIELLAEVATQDEANEITEAFAYDSRRPYSHVQVCELAGLPLQASVYIHTHSSGDHEAGSPLAVCVTDKCEFGYAHHTYLGFVSNWRNEGMYAAYLTNLAGDAEKIGDFKTTLEAQAALLRAVCDTIEAWAAAAHASLAIEPTPTPENADLEFEYEALSAGRAFDAPASVLNKQYEIPAELSDIETLIDEIATNEYEDLQAIDKEIADLQARLLSLGSTRQDIVEEYAYWRGKCNRAIEIAEYESSYEANEADADLRQSIWLATGQDIM